MMRFGWLLALLALLWAAGPVRADDMRPGYLELTERAPGQWQVLWRAPILGGLAVRARPRLPNFCKVSWQVPRLSGAALVAEGTARCTRPLAGARVALEGMERGFADAVLRVVSLDGAEQTARLTPAEPAVTLAVAPERGAVWRTYLGLGIEHILTGYDHLLFVIGLVLLIGRGWMIAKTVTAFTLAHSLTLAATSLGYVLVARRPVEICIALSILFLAAEIVKAREGGPIRLSARLPWVVAFLFGLLHGLGFAAALAEIGLPKGEVVPALLAFNLGVEAGQLVTVAATLGVLALVARLGQARARSLRRATAYGIGITAAFWMIQRAAG